MRRLIVASTAFAIMLGVFSLSGDGDVSPATPAAADESTTTIYWYNPITGAPFTVPAYSEPSNTYFDVPEPCTACYITGITPDLEYDTTGPGDGPGPWATSDFATGGMLHHMVLFNYAFDDATCGNIAPISLVGERFFASGNERATLAFPAGYGYFLPDPATRLHLNVMIHNVTNESMDFRLAMTFKYHPASDALKKVRHVWLDENNCATSQYAVPTGYDDRHWDWTSGSVPAATFDDVEGTIIAIGGHVHDWGISISAEKNPGQVPPQFICTSVAGYGMDTLVNPPVESPFDPLAVASPPRPNDAGHAADATALNPGDPAYDGHIQSMTGCASSVKIGPGDTIRLHTQYNATAPVGDVMGIMGFWSYDNCPDIANGNQANADKDLNAAGATTGGVPIATDDVGDACDLDDDNDAYGADPGFTDVVEIAIGTNPLDNCPLAGPGSGGDSWPLDNVVNGFANVLDVISYAGKIPAAVDGTHPKRLDLDNNTFLNVLDVIKYAGKIPSTCT